MRVYEVVSLDEQDRKAVAEAWKCIAVMGHVSEAGLKAANQMRQPNTPLTKPQVAEAITFWTAVVRMVEGADDDNTWPVEIYGRQELGDPVKREQFRRAMADHAHGGVQDVQRVLRILGVALTALRDPPPEQEDESSAAFLDRPAEAIVVRR